MEETALSATPTPCFATELFCGMFEMLKLRSCCGPVATRREEDSFPYEWTG